MTGPVRVLHETPAMGHGGLRSVASTPDEYTLQRCLTDWLNGHGTVTALVGYDGAVSVFVSSSNYRPAWTWTVGRLDPTSDPESAARGLVWLILDRLENDDDAFEEPPDVIDDGPVDWDDVHGF